MSTHEFSFVLRDGDTTIDWDPLLRAGCFDCTPGPQGTAVRLHFAREAGSRQAAVASAIRAVGLAGFLAAVEVDEEAAP